jgi:hypothetical protein
MKVNKTTKSVILTLDQTLGTLRLAPRQRSLEALGLDLAPAAAAALEQLKKHGVQVGLVVLQPLPKQVLSVLRQFLPGVEVMAPRERDWAGALKRLSAEPEHSLFVAVDRSVRGWAAKQGYSTLPHPALAALHIRHGPLLFIRASGEWEQLERLPEAVPYFSERNPDGSWSLLAATPSKTLADAGWRRLRVEVLPLDLTTEDPLFVQLDTLDPQSAEVLVGQKVLYLEGSRALLALAPDQTNDALPIHGPHGHFQALYPSPELLQPPPPADSVLRTARLALGRWPLQQIKVIQIPPDFPKIVLNLCPATASSLQADVDRYSGVSNLDASGPITSRHIQHPDNARTVQALLDELRAIGYCAYTHSFTHAGLTLHNVVADLPGRGYFRLDPDLLERIRQILLEHPMPDPPEPWLEPLARLVGKAWLEEHQLIDLPPLELKGRLERIFELNPWFPWWLKLCPLAGLGTQLVMVGCHLDSTAARTPGYGPATDPAPGADDDATGIAATLAIARYLWNFRGQLIHTVRFCFFNAEEQGLVGSKAYAATLKAAGAPIKAVVCADMIGYNSDAQRIFEVHAGYTDVAIRDQNLPIADTIAAWAACLGALAPAQIYKGTSNAGGADRNLYDGAINRSDHAAFHQQGYPAVVVSEDFFVNLATEPGADPNPNYHEADDNVIDTTYAADITCAIAFAVKELAGG